MTKLIHDARAITRLPITIVHAETDSQLRTWTVTANTTTDRPSTFDDLARSLARTPHQLRSVAYLGDEPVAIACAVPDRLKQNGSMFVSLRVNREYRRKGIGGVLHEDLISWMRANDGQQYEITVRDIVPEALAFWKRRGCEEVERDVIVALNVREYAGATTPSPGVTITSLAERPDLLRDIYEVGAATWPDIPVHEPCNVLTFDEWRELIEGHSENHPEAVFAAERRGRVVGYAHVALPPNMPEVGWHNFTGVLRECRGQGIARSLKLHIIDWARRNERSTLMTGNHEDNTPMRRRSGLPTPVHRSDAEGSGQMTGIEIRALTPDDAPACDEIIRSLPYHFGDPEGREECARAVRSHDGICAATGHELVGFVTWKHWFETAAEITWMAVHADRRGTGIGTRLVEALATSAHTQQLRFLLVTTLSPSVTEPGIADGYERTRSFYTGCGFVPTWEPEGWWNDRHQALLMVRSLA